MAIEYDHRADHYIALRVASTATHDDIKQAHRTLIRDLHPDHGGRSTSAAMVNVARDVLMNPVTRKEYDEARRQWHERNPLLSSITEAGQQLHRERARTQSPRSAPVNAQAATANSAAPSQPPPASTSRRRAEPDAAVPPSTPTAPSPAPDVQPQVPEWRANIAKAAVAADFLQATLTGRWFQAITMIGAAHILDRVIENRIGDDPERQEALDALTKDIGLLHALHYVQDLEARRAPPRRRAKVRTRTSPPRMTATSSPKAATSSRSNTASSRQHRNGRARGRNCDRVRTLR